MEDKFFNFIKKYFDINKKLSFWHKLIIILLLSIIIIQTKYYFSDNNKEGFAQDKPFVSYSNPTDIFDDFYTSIYDELGLDTARNVYEIAEILRDTTEHNTKEADLNFLDVGCGNGHHVNILKKNNLKALGLDISKQMVERAKKNYPESNFMVGNVEKTDLFDKNYFTHITCLYFTIYYIKDKNLFFKNCYSWLSKDGYLAIHLVNREKFDPILTPANPIVGIDIQKHAKKRITESNITFDNFKYNANFEINNDKAIFTENFKDSQNHTRQNIHNLYMEKQQTILEIAQRNGFKLIGHINLQEVEYNHQYIYILKKI